MGRIDLRPGESTSRETPCYHFKNDKYCTHRTNPLKSGRTAAGWNDFWAKRTDTDQIIYCATIPPPSHTIVSIETNPFMFLYVIGKFSIRLVPNMTPETVKEQVFKYIRELHEKRGSPNTLK